MGTMSLAIALIVSVCNPPSSESIKKRVTELERANPGAKVSVRVDKKCLK